MDDDVFKNEGVSKKRDNAYYPLVSIITPTLNGIEFLETCIKSVLNQEYPHIEHIFVDGGSTDGTLKVLADYQAKYPERIRIITGRDSGVGDAVNKGLRAVKGEILGWIDSDDMYEPDAVMIVTEFFRRNAGACFVFGGCNMINENGEMIGSFTIKDFNLKEALNNCHYIVFCATFYRREVIEKAGYFNTLGNDLDFWIRVYKRFKMYRIENVLCNWRLHQGGISLGRGTRAAKIRKERLRQDCILCLRNGGSIFSPRCSRYYAALLTPIAGVLRPILGRFYPFITKCLGISDVPFVKK